MKELYFIIRNEKLPEKPKNESFPIGTMEYTDPHHMFTKFPSDTKTHMVLEEIVQALHSKSPEEADQILSDPGKDGKKEILESLIANCQRKKAFEKGAKTTCSQCWRETMHNIFFMVSEMLVVELKNRSHQILTMLGRGDITQEDALDLSSMMAEIIKKMHKLVKRSESSKMEKKEWNEIIEATFQLLIDLVNELMMRYVLTNKVKNSIVNQQAVEVVL